MNQRVYNKNTIEFITVAKELVTICEKQNKYTAYELAVLLQRLLPLLYLKASLLPDFEEQEEDIPEIVDEFLYENIKHKYEEIFGELDLDCSLPENMVQPQEQNFTTLSELIADVYQDIKNVLVNYQTGNEAIMEMALFICKQNFEIYWGQRLLLAIHILHYLIFNKKEAFENIQPKKQKNIDDIDKSEWIFSKIQNLRKL